ncbi:endonuclease/exonuclease/phosphatase family protein [Actinoplanes sp. CA-030573]|uniref:endonuclease/exonuclease/phosphatase family protein n=1 Tax=Actinoplanes sp. CA-030573 TaxID=3239898 RepID=UPI003D89BE42
MRIRLVLTLLLAAVVAALPGAAPVQAYRPALRALTFNACGNVCRYGEVGMTSANIAYQARNLKAQIVMLQELCYSQFLSIRARLAPYGYTAAFGTASVGGKCDNDDHQHGEAFGVAILARGTILSRYAHRMPSPDRSQAEGRVLLAANVRLPGRSLFVVTTHTAHSGENRVAQIAALRRWITPYARSRPVLFGGDLNLPPDSTDLDGFYQSFGEADDSRDHPLATFQPFPQRKIDYLFGSNGHLAPAGAGRVCGGYSDHCMYLGSFR